MSIKVSWRILVVVIFSALTAFSAGVFSGSFIRSIDFCSQIDGRLNYTNQITRLQEQIEQLENELSRSRNTINFLNSTNIELNKQLDEAKDLINDLQKTIIELNSTVVELKEQIDYSPMQLGAGVAMNVFHPKAFNYLPNAWEIIKDLGINVIRVWTGIEGNLWHIHIIDHPDEWAQNLDAFLTEADRHGIKIIFHSLGNRYGNPFGIVSPGINGATPTPIEEAKVLIDKLAGDNILEHDFITDPRVLGWRTSNEVDISDEETLRWNLELCDYIRSKGGRAWLASPEYEGSRDFHLIEPLLSGHVDYLELHHYPVDSFNSLGRSYEPFYHAVKVDLMNLMVEGRGRFSMDQIILGEFGIWRGSQARFTDRDRLNYYKAMLDAAKDVGIKNILFHDLFAQIHPQTKELLTPNYAIVDEYGNYYPYVADLVKESYKNVQERR